MGVNRIAMALIVVPCGGLALMILNSGQPLERTGGILAFLVAIVLLGWLGLRNARRKQQKTEAMLRTAGPASAEKWRLGISVLLIVLGIIVLATLPRKISGYIFIGAGLAGLLGVNVFRGGPLDQRRPKP